MGIDTGCMLIVGRHADDFNATDGLKPEIAKQLEADGFYGAVGEEGPLKLTYASPYFDSGSEARVWGITLASEYWGAKEIEISTLPQKIAEASAKFKELTGLDAKLFISPHVT